MSLDIYAHVLSEIKTEDDIDVYDFAPREKFDQIDSLYEDCTGFRICQSHRRVLKKAGIQFPISSLSFNQKEVQDLYFKISGQACLAESKDELEAAKDLSEFFRVCINNNYEVSII